MIRPAAKQLLDHKAFRRPIYRSARPDDYPKRASRHSNRYGHSMTITETLAPKLGRIKHSHRARACERRDSDFSPCVTIHLLPPIGSHHTWQTLAKVPELLDRDKCQETLQKTQSNSSWRTPSPGVSGAKNHACSPKHRAGFAKFPSAWH